VQEQLLEKEFFLHPQRHGHQEGTQPFGSERYVSLQKPLKLEQGLIVEDDIGEIRQLDLPRLQAILNGSCWKTRIVLLARESFFLRRCHYFAVPDKTGCAIVIESRDP